MIPDIPEVLLRTWARLISFSEKRPPVVHGRGKIASTGCHKRVTGDERLRTITRPAVIQSTVPAFEDRKPLSDPFHNLLKSKFGMSFLVYFQFGTGSHFRQRAMIACVI